MNPDPAFRSAQARYDNLLPEDVLGHPDEPQEPEEKMRSHPFHILPEIVSECGWCHSILSPDGEWFEPGLEFMRFLRAEGVEISHGVCPVCDGKMREAIKKALP